MQKLKLVTRHDNQRHSPTFCNARSFLHIAVKDRKWSHSLFSKLSLVRHFPARSLHAYADGKDTEKHWSCSPIPKDLKTSPQTSQMLALEKLGKECSLWTLGNNSKGVNSALKSYWAMSGTTVLVYYCSFSSTLPPTLFSAVLGQRPGLHQKQASHPLQPDQLELQLVFMLRSVVAPVL